MADELNTRLDRLATAWQVSSAAGQSTNGDRPPEGLTEDEAAAYRAEALAAHAARNALWFEAMAFAQWVGESRLPV
jgi:hypothetical protein